MSSIARSMVKSSCYGERWLSIVQRMRALLGVDEVLEEQRRVEAFGKQLLQALGFYEIVEERSRLEQRVDRQASSRFGGSSYLSPADLLRMESPPVKRTAKCRLQIGFNGGWIEDRPNAKPGRIGF